jgi:L-serine deaminase
MASSSIWTAILNGGSGSTPLTMEYYHHVPPGRKNKSYSRMMNYKNAIIEYYQEADQIFLSDSQYLSNISQSTHFMI